MTLPVNTGLEIHAHQPTSAAEIFAAKRERDRKWGIDKIAPPRARAVRPQQSPSAEALTPVQFVRAKCGEYGFDLALLRDKSNKSRLLVAQRDRLISDVYQAYPKLSRAQIGKLFGGMHDSSVFASLQRSGIHLEKRVVKAQPVDRMIYLRNLGYPQKEIAKMVGCSPSTVSLILNGKVGNKPKPRLIADHMERIAELYRAGMSLGDIAGEIEFTHASLCRFVRRQGWTR